MGGSGKTPFVIALGSLLKERGIEFDILSRGYGRSSQEIAVVDPTGTPEQFAGKPVHKTRKPANTNTSRDPKVTANQSLGSSSQTT